MSTTFRHRLIIDLQARLLAQVPGLQAVAPYNSQPDDMKAPEGNLNHPFPTPVIFIALQGGTWRTDAASNRYSDDYRIRLHVVTSNFSDDHHTAPAQAAALDARYSILQSATNALHAWAGATDASFFYLIEEALDESHTHLIEDVLTFTTRVLDASLADAIAAQAITATSQQVIRTAAGDGHQENNP